MTRIPNAWIVLGLITSGWISHTALAETDLKPPVATGQSNPPQAPISRIFIPVSMPISSIAAIAEAKTPPSEGGSKNLRNFGPASNNVANFNFNRSKLSVTGGDNQLNIAGTVSGNVRVSGRIKPIRGGAGRLLGGLNPRVPYSQNVNLAGDVNALLKPQLNENWRVVPGITGGVALTEVKARIAKVFTLSLRGELQGDVNKAINKAITKLNTEIASNPFLENIGKKAWSDLCEPIEIKTPDGLLYLHISPKQFHATQPSITAQNFSIALGLETLLDINDKSTRANPCPSFNNILAIDKEVDKVTTLRVNASFSFDTLNAQLSGLAEKPIKSDSSGIKVHSATLTHHGDKLLITIDADFQHIGWIWDDVKRQTVYLTVKPILDSEQQVLRFQEVSLDVASQTVIGGFFSAIAGTFAPLLEQNIQQISIDLKPEIKKAKERVSAAKEDLVKKTGPLTISTLELNELKALQLWHDVRGINVAIDAKAQIAAQLQAFDEWPPK